jgi:hypothetical protein
VDEYIASLECQWLDITDLDHGGEATELPLSFVVNGEQFLCEGTPVLDENGRQRWEPTEFVNDFGAVIYRPMCEFMSGWQDNNQGGVTLSIYPEGGFVTQPCATEMFGPLRNCGFTAQTTPFPFPPQIINEGEDDEEVIPFACAPGQRVEMTCSVTNTAVPQTLRVCEYSSVLGTGTACVFEEALANVLVSGETAVSFTCPFIRGENEPGGRFSFYTAPLLNSDPRQPVSCTFN